MNCSECYGVAVLFEEAIKMEPELSTKKEYTIDDRKKIYRGFAKRCKKEIRRRLGWSLTEIGNFSEQPHQSKTIIHLKGELKI